MVTLAVDTAVVTTILPKGLSLAPSNLTAPGTHPMVFAFGNQSHVRPVALKLFDWTYLEYIHSVPNVLWCDGGACHGPFMYQPTLYLDEFPPTALGWMYGLKKHVVHSYASGEGMQAIPVDKLP